MSVIHVDVVSATEEIYSGDANCVFAPATMGEIGVYPQHVPLISTLKPSGGIVEVQPHTVTIFSDTAIRANDLDEAKAIEAKQRAEEAMSNAQSDQDVSTTQAALAESMAQLQMISKMRSKNR